MTIPVYAKGLHINDNGELVIDADALAEAGVRSVELIEGQPPAETRGDEPTPKERQMYALAHFQQECGRLMDKNQQLEARLDSIDEALDDADAPDSTEAHALHNDPIIERIILWRHAQDVTGDMFEAREEASARAFSAEVEEWGRQLRGKQAELDKCHELHVAAEAEAARLRAIADKLWQQVNEWRCRLIEWKRAGDVSERDLAELAKLQTLADEWQKPCKRRHFALAPQQAMDTAENTRREKVGSDE